VIVKKSNEVAGRIAVRTENILLDALSLLEHCHERTRRSETFDHRLEAVEQGVVECGVNAEQIALVAGVVLAWALQRGTAPLTTATGIRHIEENFDISALPDNAIEEITQGISTRVRLNSVVDTGIPGSFPGQAERQNGISR
jgi:diketogulonate reductase-like aldo/keto reductase